MVKFDQHLFISYAHLDNQPLTRGEQGWVTRFHDTLEALLSMHLGSRARVWRDQKLQGNDDFDSEIVDQFGHTAGLIAVLTPRYLKSEWCTREIREFCEAAEQSGGALVDNKSRVFKVIKTPVGSQDSLPEPVKKVLGYDFFVLQDDDTPLELDPAYGDEFAHGFAQKVARLSWQIAQLLNGLESAGDDADDPGRAASEKSTVYLAECSSDMRDARELLAAELARLGYAVLPDRRLPADEADYVQAVDDLLQRSALSVHLVGAQYGLVPDGPTLKSAPMHQNELAAGRSRSAGLRRVIWLPDGTRSEQEVQQAFIDSLHQDEAAQVGSDLITGDLEALRAAVHATLETIESERARPDSSDDIANDAAAKRVYLLCDQEDRKATVPIRKYLGRFGIEVDLPAFEGEAAEVRRANQTLMEGCDVVLLFYGAGDEAWKRTIDSELRKLPGYKPGSPPPVVHTYLAAPRTPDKDDLVDMEEPNLIEGFDGFSEPSMSGLLATIGESADGS